MTQGSFLFLLFFLAYFSICFPELLLKLPSPLLPYHRPDVTFWPVLKRLSRDSLVSCAFAPTPNLFMRRMGESSVPLELAERQAVSSCHGWSEGGFKESKPEHGSVCNLHARCTKPPRWLTACRTHPSGRQGRDDRTMCAVFSGIVDVKWCSVQRVIEQWSELLCVRLW